MVALMLTGVDAEDRSALVLVLVAAVQTKENQGFPQKPDLLS